MDQNKEPKMLSYLAILAGMTAVIYGGAKLSGQFSEEILRAPQTRIEQTEEQAIVEGKNYMMNEIKSLENKAKDATQEAKFQKSVNIYNLLLKEERDCFENKYGFYIEATEPVEGLESELKTPKPLREYNPEKINDLPMILRSVD